MLVKVFYLQVSRNSMVYIRVMVKYSLFQVTWSGGRGCCTSTLWKLGVVAREVDNNSLYSL